MLLPTHIAVGYIVGDLVGRHACESCGSDFYRPVVGATLLFSILPDIDFLLLLAEKGRAALGSEMSEHHHFLTHTPALYICAALLAILVLPKVHVYLWMISACLIGAIGHLALDTIWIGHGIMWLYPLSNTLWGEGYVTSRYGAQWGDHWLRAYLRSPYALPEAGLIFFAAAQFWYRGLVYSR